MQLHALHLAALAAIRGTIRELFGRHLVQYAHSPDGRHLTRRVCVFPRSALKLVLLRGVLSCNSEIVRLRLAASRMKANAE